MTAIIVEDEERHQLKLMKLLQEEHPDIIVLGVANTLKKASDLLQKYTPDILFLDIELGADNGLSLIRDGIPPNVSPIVVSSYTKYGVAACNLSAIAFVLKQELEEELSKAIEKVKTNKKNNFQPTRNKIFTQTASKISKGDAPDRIVVSTKSVDFFVSIDSIIYLEAKGNNVKFILEGGKDIPNPSHGLKFYSDGLLPIWPNFQRIHYSFLVNMDKVDAREKEKPQKLVMRNGDKVPISRANESKVKKILDKLGIP